MKGAVATPISAMKKLLFWNKPALKEMQIERFEPSLRHSASVNHPDSKMQPGQGQPLRYIFYKRSKKYG